MQSGENDCCCGGSCLGRALCWLWHGWWLLDWLVAGVLLAIHFIVPTEVLRPVDRFFLNTDATLSYPYNEGTISGDVLAALVVPLPVLIFSVVCAVRRDATDWHHACLTLFESAAVSIGFKRWMNLVGCLRPSFIAGAAANGGDWDSGHESYPSGHSAYMFFAMTTLSLWLCGLMRIFYAPGRAGFLKALVCLLPIVLATFVAMTRITDYKHHPSDVNAGAFIGIVPAIFCYSLNYHSLFGPHSGKPKQRTFGGDAATAAAAGGASGSGGALPPLAAAPSAAAGGGYGYPPAQQQQMAVIRQQHGGAPSVMAYGQPQAVAGYHPAATYQQQQQQQPAPRVRAYNFNKSPGQP